MGQSPGVNHEGINAEVAKGQWQFQIFGKGSKKAADDVWVARYLMARLDETFGLAIDKFNYGVGNRGASVRIPHSFVNSGYKEYLEDRRPNSAGDPYKIASRILQTIATVPTS